MERRPPPSVLVNASGCSRVSSSIFDIGLPRDIGLAGDTRASCGFPSFTFAIGRQLRGRMPVTALRAICHRHELHSVARGAKLTGRAIELDLAIVRVRRDADHPHRIEILRPIDVSVQFTTVAEGVKPRSLRNRTFLFSVTLGRAKIRTRFYSQDALMVQGQVPGEAHSKAPAGPRPARVSEEAVREELSRVLSCHEFRLSKRSQDFVRYVVEHTLTGREDMLKERTIGIEVFGRSTSYEPSDDATVRVKAGDVRKRLGLYYAEEGAHNPVRIELPAGTYVPEFRWSDTAVPLAEPNALPEPAAIA